jgi:hypothetical protein
VRRFLDWLLGYDVELKRAELQQRADWLRAHPNDEWARRQYEECCRRIFNR